MIDGKMPPLGRNLVDQVYVDSLAKWIDGLEESADTYHQLIAFPNPTEGQLNVVLSESFSFPDEVKVYSVSGRLILQKSSMKRQFVLDLSSYPRGTYMMVFEADGEKQVKKIVLF